MSPTVAACQLAVDDLDVADAPITESAGRSPVAPTDGGDERSDR